MGWGSLSLSLSSLSPTLSLPIMLFFLSFSVAKHPNVLARYAKCALLGLAIRQQHPKQSDAKRKKGGRKNKKEGTQK